MQYKYVVVDLETTGLYPSSEGVTELVGIAYTSNFNSQKTIENKLTNPSKEIPKFIQELTGITNEMVKYMEEDKEVITRFINKVLLDKLTIIAHNAKFEKDFIDEKGTFFAVPDYICTRALFLVYKDGNTWENNYKKNYSKLKQVCEEFNVAYDDNNAHRAEYDVLKTAIVAAKLIDHFGHEKSIEISKAYISGKGWGQRSQLELDLEGVY